MSDKQIRDAIEELEAEKQIALNKIQRRGNIISISVGIAVFLITAYLLGRKVLVMM